MKLKIRDRNYDLSITKVMGILALNLEETLDLEELIKKAQSMYASGAEFVELVVKGEVVEELAERELLVKAVAALAQKTRLVIAARTVYPETMQAVVDAGASIIISSDALRHEGAMEKALELKVPVCLQFDENIDCSGERDDAIATVSEFLFERIDACLNAGMSRKLLMIDPLLGKGAPVKAQLKLIGRLDTLKTFGVPISFTMPRPLSSHDDFLKDNPNIAQTLALFCADKGTVQILRTESVADMALALGTWQLLLATTKPFKFSKAIIRRFRNVRDRLKRRKED
jgi:dihydropteroate synthase